MNARDENTRAQKLARHFPKRFQAELAAQLKDPRLTEIRVRVGYPVQIRRGSLELLFLTGEPVSLAECKELFESVCEHSVYAWENELREGFLTLEGGFRVGLAGRFVVEEERIARIHAPTYFHFRVAREWIGCALKSMAYVTFAERPLSALIVSPPGCGKTTLLRDIARTLSYRRFNVCVVDERCELAGSREGVPMLDLGPCCDVLDACPKASGMMMALRVMGPDVLVCDEIGKREDLFAVKEAMQCGCKVIASAHASSAFEVKQRLGENLPFERYLVLGATKGPGTLLRVEDAQGGLLFEGGRQYAVHA